MDMMIQYAHALKRRAVYVKQVGPKKQRRNAGPDGLSAEMTRAGDDELVVLDKKKGAAW